jgi:hypothetical protein
MERRVVALEGEAQRTLDRAQQALDCLGVLHEDLRKLEHEVRALRPRDEKAPDPSEDTPRP